MPASPRTAANPHGKHTGLAALFVVLGLLWPFWTQADFATAPATKQAVGQGQRQEAQPQIWCKQIGEFHRVQGPPATDTKQAFGQ